MQEMESLWRYGEPMYDVFQKEDVICRAIIFITTNDYPVLFSLSGQIKGKMGCLVCLDGTTWVYLDASKKIVYLRNRRFLKTSHKTGCSATRTRFGSRGVRQHERGSERWSRGVRQRDFEL